MNITELYADAKQNKIKIRDVCKEINMSEYMVYRWKQGIKPLHENWVKFTDAYNKLKEAKNGL